MTNEEFDALHRYVSESPISNPINITFTLKQSLFIGGCRFQMDEIRSSRNFRHFLNRLNRVVHGNAAKRFNMKLQSLVVLEYDAIRRYHIHSVIGHPAQVGASKFMREVSDCWSKTQWARHGIHHEVPDSETRRTGWIDYMLKFKTKPDGLVASIDWENCTCFE